MSSSDEEVIKRYNSRHPRRNYENEESYSEDISSSSMDQQYDPLFLEIFGTGTEYSYIYKKKEEQQKDVLDSHIAFTAQEAMEYIKNRTEIPLDVVLIDNLIKGYTAEYIVFHLNKMSILECYALKDLLDEFKEYLQIPNKPSLTDSLLSANLYNKKDKDIQIDGLLTITEYSENLLAGERINEPRGNLLFPKSQIDFSAINYTEEDEILKSDIKNNFQKVINQLSNSPVFQDRIFLATEKSLIKNTPIDITFLERLYTTESDTEDNKARRMIIKLASEQVDVGIEDIKRNLILSGRIDSDQLVSYWGFREMVDVMISIRGNPGVYAGMILENSYCQIVIIDKMGEIQETGIFLDSNYNQIRSFVSSVDCSVITSSSENIKYFLQNISIPILYVPIRFSYFNEIKEFSIPYNIACLVQSPILYFSKVLSEIKLENDIKKMLKKAIKVAASCIKTDWRYIVTHKLGYLFLNLIEITLSEKYFDYEKIESLEKLRDIFSDVEFCNICTYFYLPSSTDAFDHTFVHPINYNIANILCKGIMSKNNNYSNNLEVIKDLEAIRGMQIPEDLNLVLMHLGAIKNILLRINEITFSGATDKQIFEEIVLPLEINLTYKGIIKKVVPDFYLGEITHNNINPITNNNLTNNNLTNNKRSATVYVKKSEDYQLNQIVDFKILEKNYSMLSYSGEIIQEKFTSIGKYRTHPLYKCLDTSNIEEYMEKHNILIRDSSRNDSLVVVCKIDNNLYYSLRVTEILDNQGIYYSFKGSSYDDLDSFIDNYIKKMYQNIYDIKKHRHYYSNKEDALN